MGVRVGPPRVLVVDKGAGAAAIVWRAGHSGPPPMYSAVHHAGRRLYELAREGIEVDREPREVVVRSIVVDEIAPPRATLRVVCGKGTYVRVLAADVGAALGYGGAVERLVRGRVGPLGPAGRRPLAGVTRGDVAGALSRR